MKEQFVHKTSESRTTLFERIDLEVGGKIVGRAELRHYGVETPVWLIHTMKIPGKEQGKGYASKMMRYIESFLVERNVPGILINNIPENNPAHEMVQNRGWKKIPGTKYGFAFNVSDDEIGKFQSVIE